MLLKNDGPLLPLRLPRRGSDGEGQASGGKVTIAVIGHEATGLTVAGGGSGHVTPSNMSSPLAAIRHRAGIVGNASCNAAGTVCVEFQDVTASEHIAQAVALAKAATHAFVFVATSSAEGTDRMNLTLSDACQQTTGGACASPLAGKVDQDELIHAVVGAAYSAHAIRRDVGLGIV